MQNIHAKCKQIIEAHMDELMELQQKLDDVIINKTHLRILM